MGQVFSQNYNPTFHVDTSLDIVSSADAFNTLQMAGIVAACMYVMAMIGTTCALIDRWGMDRKASIGFSSVLGAFLIATMWPIVVLYLMFAG